MDSSVEIHIIRAVLDRLPTGSFREIKRKFGNIKSISEFITDRNYLGGVKVKVQGLSSHLEKLLPEEKFRIASFIISKILDEVNKKEKKYYGTSEFISKNIKDTIKEKVVLYIDKEKPRAKEMAEFNFQDKNWFAQNNIWGTNEEKSFMNFMEKIVERLKKKYSEVSVLRNEEFFKIYNFDDGEGFSPDFVLFLKEKRSSKYLIYQVFIESKGDQFKDSYGRFENSKEGWKQKFLLEIEKKADTDLKLENKHFKLMGLPFYNEKLKKDFEEVLESKILS